MPVARDKRWWPMRGARSLPDTGYLSGSGQWDRLGSGWEGCTKRKGPLLEVGWGGSQQGVSHGPGGGWPLSGKLLG